jgi:hypothetical protein
MSLDVYLTKVKRTTVYEANITHNLGAMAMDAGIYFPLWRPEEIGIKTAGELIEPLEKGLELLKSDPKRFKKLNSDNRWGMYDDFVSFVEGYLKACKDNKNSKINVSR